MLGLASLFYLQEYWGVRQIKKQIAAVQYYEFKILHNTEVNWFQRFAILLKLINLIKTAKESHSDIHKASFSTFNAKIGRVLGSQSMFEFPWKIVILVDFEP